MYIYHIIKLVIMHFKNMIPMLLKDRIKLVLISVKLGESNPYELTTPFLLRDTVLILLLQSLNCLG